MNGDALTSLLISFSLASLHSSTPTNSHPLRYLKLCVTFWNISIVQIRSARIKFMANPIPTQAGTEVYSVWALPPESVRARLKSLMSGLRSEFGGPEFEPHITVVGAIRLTPESALEMIRSSTSGLRPYKVKVASVSRNLLIEPSKEVLEAREHVCGHFGYQSSTPYIPHLSLLYGDLTDEEKEKVVKKIEELDQEVCGLEFEISELALYKTDPEDKSLKSWEKIEVCRLDGK